MTTRFGDVVHNWWAIMKRQKRLTWFQSGYGQTAIIFPLVVAAPHFFAGTIVTGPSGSGKSTLFRAFAGIWPFGSGTVRWPTAARALFLPQKPYLVVGKLRDQLTYPAQSEKLPDAVLTDALLDCGLPHLAHRLDEEHNWAQVLSGGEQQRVAFARALLYKPQWLFMDEATASLDNASETALYTLLRERLPDTSIVSIGYHPNLARFHARRLRLERDCTGLGHLIAKSPSESSQLFVASQKR